MITTADAIERLIVGKQHRGVLRLAALEALSRFSPRSALAPRHLMTSDGR
ncbi:MAG: hypothetical protein AAF250_11970 [Pseudomonadota bacterium]